MHKFLLPPLYGRERVQVWRLRIVKLINSYAWSFEIPLNFLFIFMITCVINIGIKQEGPRTPARIHRGLLSWGWTTGRFRRCILSDALKLLYFFPCFLPNSCISIQVLWFKRCLSKMTIIICEIPIAIVKRIRSVSNIMHLL